MPRTVKQTLTKAEKQDYSMLVKQLYRKAKENENQPKENPKAKAKRLASYRKDPQAYINYYFEDDVKGKDGKSIPIMDFHRDVFTELKEDKRSRVCLEWSRSLSKTTITSLFSLVYLITTAKYNDFKPHYILLVGNKITDARKRLLQLKAHFERNDRLVEDYGEFQEEGAIWSADRIELLSRKVLIQAVSIGESVRGSNYLGFRPDLIILDDCSDNEMVLNSTRVQDTWDSIKQNIFGTIDAAKNYKYVYVENAYSANNLVVKFKKEYIDDYILNGGDPKNTLYSHVNILTDDNKSVWPQRFSREDIAELERDWYTFQREYMQEWVVSAKFFKPDMVKYTTILPLERYTRIFSYYDPSISEKGDYKSVTVAGITEDNKFHIIDVFCRKCSFNEVIEYHYELMERIPGIHMYIENLFAQATHHLPYLKDKQEVTGVYLPLIKDNDKKINKEQRISSMLPFFLDEIIFFNSELKDEGDFKVGLNQMYAFNVMGNNTNDDFLDSMESCLRKLNKFRKSNGSFNVPSIVRSKSRSSY